MILKLAKFTKPGKEKKERNARKNPLRHGEQLTCVADFFGKAPNSTARPLAIKSS